MLILLVGPKGSGKSHLGRILESRLGVYFFHVEPLWQAYYAECRALGQTPVIAEGIAQIRPPLLQALLDHAHVCVETTGASREILDALLSLRPRSEILVARLSVPLALCLRRIATRDPTHQIPVEEEMIRKIYALSTALALDADIVLENTELSDNEMAEQFRSRLGM